MSYVQIEIGGKLRGLKFNQFALAEHEVISEGNKNPVFHSYSLIYAGLLGNCKVKREELTHTVDDKEVVSTFEDVTEWVDKISDPEIFKSVLAAYKSALPEPEKPLKKKAVKKIVPQKNIKKRVLK